MPEIKVVEEAPVDEPAAVAGPAKGKTLGIIVGAVALGISLGAFALGPQLGGGGGGSAKKSSSGSHGGGGAHGGGGGAHGGGSMLEIDNVVVNPMGAQGAHFLMATVTMAVHDEDAEEYLRMNEHVVKDVILNTLGNLTLEQLSQPGSRDELKALIAQDVGELIGGAELLTVYLPEFVVQ